MAALIRDRKSLEAWLLGRSGSSGPFEAYLLALRVSQRLLPLRIGGLARNDFDPNSNFANVHLIFLRDSLRKSLRARLKPDLTSWQLQVDELVADIEFLNQVAASLAASAAHSAASAAAIAATGNGSRAAEHAASAANFASISHTYADGPKGSWIEIEHDANIVDEQLDPSAQPLWASELPVWFSQVSSAFATRLEKTRDWVFWTRWWDGILSGQQLDWNLQETVALIPDEVWEAGPGAVAEAISTIEERLRLLGEVSAIKERLLQLQNEAIAEAAPAERRAHNHPPELIAAEEEAIRDVATLVDALSSAEIELKKSTPAAPVLLRLVKTIRAVTLRLAAYCGGKVDVALNKASEEVGGAVAKWGIRLFGLQMASQIEPLKSLASALTEFLKRLAQM